MDRTIIDINEELGIPHSPARDEFIFVVGTDGKFPHKDALRSHYKSGSINDHTIYKFSLPSLFRTVDESNLYAEMIGRGVASRDFDLRGCVTLLFKNNELVDTKCDPPSEDAEDVEAA